MTVGRLSGDFVTARVGDRAMLFWGGLATMGGFVLVLSAPIASLAMSGFLLIGLGASNIVPVLFRGAGAQRAMPAGLAVAAITTAGYRAFSSVRLRSASLQNRRGFQLRFGCRLHSSAR